jgi:hypothetical protein
MAMIGSYLANAMFHDLSIIPMVNMALFFLAGLTSGRASQLKAEPVSSPAEPAALSRRLLNA